MQKVDRSRPCSGCSRSRARAISSASRVGKDACADGSIANSSVPELRQPLLPASRQHPVRAFRFGSLPTLDVALRNRVRDCGRAERILRSEPDPLSWRWTYPPGE